MNLSMDKRARKGKNEEEEMYPSIKDAEFFTVFMYSIISQAFCVIALRGSVLGRERKKNKGPVR